VEDVPKQDLTALLRRAGGGDSNAQSQVWQSAYGELHIMARGVRSGYRHRGSGIPSPTTIIHEAFIKAFGGERVNDWDNRAHFYGSLARAMGQFLVDWRRAQTRVKRGGGISPTILGDAAESIPDIEPLSDFERAIREVTPELVESLREMQNGASHIADVVWLRYMAGLSLSDTAAILGIAPRTVSKRWNIGRAMLKCSLSAKLENGAHSPLEFHEPV
jgi:RNA polymerase sigma factor (TIGR02999 family)